MFESARLVYVYVESPLHAGSGRELGAVDLPIQRERVTGYPLVQASGLKGALRSVCEKRSGDKSAIRYVFGPDTDKASEHAGAVSPGDARLLLFPVRSLAGVFAWTTSADILARFQRDAKAAGENLSWTPPAPPADDAALVTTHPAIIAGGRVVLEEFAFTPDSSQSQAVDAIAKWLAERALPGGGEYKYWKDKVPTSLVVLPDNAFRDFTLFATEVVTRVKLDSTTKTVDKKVGGLWTEEHLPVDTLLYAPMAAAHPRAAKKNGQSEPLPANVKSATAALEFVSKWLDGQRIQLGGDETVGRGLVSLRFGAVNSLNGKEASHG